MSERTNDIGMPGYLTKADMDADRATTEAADGLVSVAVSDGKYTIRQTAPGAWEALRWGEEWPAFSKNGPDNLHVALAYEVSRLRALQDELVSSLQELGKRCNMFPEADYHVRARAAVAKAQVTA